jgi:predicted glycosyltransferase
MILKVLVIISHPCNVHLFKNLIWNLEEHGHSVKIVAKEKDVAFYLLDKYGFEYTPIGKMHSSIIGKAYELIAMDWNCYRLARKFGPDLLIGTGNPHTSHVSKLVRKTSVEFDDDEYARIVNMLYVPFADVICTPSSYKKGYGNKQVRYDSYKELAYLHPNRFKPEPSILSDMGLSNNERFAILRFSGWQAMQGVGAQTGFDLEAKQRLVKECAKYARVFITSEDPLPKELEHCRIRIPPERIHDALYYATLFITDGGTMAAEAGILGTPSIRSNSSVGLSDRGWLFELEHKYNLIFALREIDQVVAKAKEILEQPDIKREWAKKRERLLKDKIDLTGFMTWFVESYPESFQIMKENPDYQERFK